MQLSRCSSADAAQPMQLSRQQPAQQLAQQQPPSIERIEKQTAAANEPPNLRSYPSQALRGPSSDPARWYMKMTGESWDGTSLSYEKAKKCWRGLMGDNERRVEQRRQSFQQSQDNNEYQQERRRRELDEADAQERAAIVAKRKADLAAVALMQEVRHAAQARQQCVYSPIAIPSHTSWLP